MLVVLQLRSRLTIVHRRCLRRYSRAPGHGLVYFYVRPVGSSTRRSRCTFWVDDSFCAMLRLEETHATLWSVSSHEIDRCFDHISKQGSAVALRFQGGYFDITFVDRGITEDSGVSTSNTRIVASSALLFRSRCSAESIAHFLSESHCQ